MKKIEKQEVITRFSERLQKAKGMILAEYRGLKVSEITELRREVKKNAGDFRVVKNRLVKRAVEGSSWELLRDHLKGPIAIALADEDPVTLSKLLTKYGESFPALKLKVGVVGGKFLDAKAIDALAKLPSKEELYAKLLGTLIGPIQGVVRTIHGVPQKLAIALKAISEKKQ